MCSIPGCRGDIFFPWIPYIYQAPERPYGDLSCTGWSMGRAQTKHTCAAVPPPVPEIAMAPLDTILSVVFGTLSLSGLIFAIWSFRKALRVSGEKDGDIKMFFWASGTLLGLMVSGLSAAYILLPILLHYVGGF